MFKKIMIALLVGWLILWVVSKKDKMQADYNNAVENATVIKDKKDSETTSIADGGNKSADSPKPADNSPGKTPSGF